MKNVLLKNWHVTRWLRLAFALFLFIQAYATQEWFFIAFGFFFLFQVVVNIGCGSNGCEVQQNK